MIQIDKGLILGLFAKAEASERKRMNYDLRTSPNDGGQHMLNALLPGTDVPIYRHPSSNENVILLQGKLVEVIYEEDPPTPLKGEPELLRGGFEAEVLRCSKVTLHEKERIVLDPSAGNFGCVVPAGAWHTVEVLEPSVIYEAKDGKYGEDGSQSFAEFQGSGSKFQNSGSKFISRASVQEKQGSEDSGASFSNSLGNLKKNIEYLIGMERQSGSMDAISPLYVARMLNVPFEEVEKCMKEMGGVSKVFNKCFEICK